MNNPLPKQSPETLTREERAARFRLAAALCAGTCVTLCITSYMVGNIRELTLRAAEAQCAANTLKTIADPSSCLDKAQYLLLDYISTSIGVLGCLVGWAVPVIQIASCGKPLGLRLPKAAVIALSGISLLLVAAVLTLPWLLGSLHLSSSTSPSSILGSPPTNQYHFYLEYKILFIVFEIYVISVIIISIIIAVHKICTALIDSMSPKNAETPAGMAAKAPETARKFLSGCLMYPVFYIFLFICSFWYVIVI